ncbi:MAG: CDP-alcohol phosphatidyltransferase family protein [Candidatus Kaiserbacteria bacterium]|nr:CDP-alcohol phosphatidyltransferase family protein [Candidatus Kaiserbacteria bacterium]
MTYKGTMRTLRAIPNVLTGGRVAVAMLILFVSSWELVAHQVDLLRPFRLSRWFDLNWWYMFLSLVGAISDALDGFLARQFKEHGWETPFGRKWDPFADKVFMFVLMGVIPLWLDAGYEFLAGYVLLALFISWYSWQTSRMRWEGLIESANFPAKVKTFALMFSQLLFMAHIAHESLPKMVSKYEVAIFTVATALMIIATICCVFAIRDYYKQAGLMIRQRQNTTRPT